MNGSSGQAVIVNGVVAPQDSLFPQASQSAVSGNKAFREALDAAAAQDKKIDVKQIDRDSLGSGGKARTDAQPALPEEAPIEAEGSSPLPQESYEIDGETQQAVDSGTQNETAVGNGLPTTERQSLPVVARLTGSGTVAGQASIQNVETPPPVSKLAGNSSAGSLTDNTSSTSSTSANGLVVPLVRAQQDLEMAGDSGKF